MSIILAGGKILGAGGSVFSVAGGGGGSNSFAPTNVVAYTTPNPTTGYVTFASANANGETITGYEADAIQSGSVVATQSTQAYSGTTVTAIPNRINFSGLANVSTTFVVRTVTTLGKSTNSSTSGAITPSSFVDSFLSSNFDPIACGGSLIGGPDGTSSYRWSNAYADGALYRSVAPGTATISGAHVPATTAPAYPTGAGMTNQLLYEITPQGGGYAMQLYIQHDNPSTSNNGGYIFRHYNYLVGMVYPFASGTYQHPACEFTFNYPDIISSYANPNVNFQYGNYPVNGFINGSTGMFDMTTGVSTAWTTNTATAFNVGNNNWNANDRFYLSIGDQARGNNITDLAKFVISPSNGVMTVGQWNTFKIPVDNTVVNGANGFNIRGISGDTIYKIHIACPNDPGVQWFCNLGWLV